MKKIIYLPIVLFPMTAMSAVTLYYTPGGECPGLYLNPSETGCPPSSEQVAKLNMKDMSGSDQDFKGISVGGKGIVNADGTIAADAAATLTQAKAAGTLTSGTKLSGTYDCKSGSARNSNGVCISASSNGSDELETYIDWAAFTNPQFDSNNNLILNSGEVLGSSITDGGKSGKWDREFKIVVHWCPKPYVAKTWTWNDNTTGGWPDIGAPTSWRGFKCNPSQETVTYYYKRGTTGQPGYYYLGTSATGTPQTQITAPTIPGYTFRGLYIVPNTYVDTTLANCTPGSSTSPANQNCIGYWGIQNSLAKSLVVDSDHPGGQARLGLPKSGAGLTTGNCLTNGTETGYIDLRDSEDFAYNTCNHTNTRWQIWSADGSDIKEIHMYAAWAKDCSDSTNCNMVVHRTGLDSATWNKGDVDYQTSCPSGSNMSGGNTYNPSCTQQCTDNTISYTYGGCVDINGNTVSCSYNMSGGTCTIGGTGTSGKLQLPNAPTLPDNYEFVGWVTSASRSFAAGEYIECITEYLVGPKGNGCQSTIKAMVCDCSDTSSENTKCLQTVCEGGGKY